MSTPDNSDREPSDVTGKAASNGSDEQQALSHVADDNDGEASEDIDVQQLIELPPEQREKVLAIIHRQSMSHSGWLPTPQFMRDYEQVLPGLAERIVAMPEREQAFRHQEKSGIVKRDYRLRSTGQWLGMVALVLLLAFCVFLAVWGSPAAAAWVAGTVIIGTVGVFVTGQIVNNKSSSKDVIEDE